MEIPLHNRLELADSAPALMKWGIAAGTAYWASVPMAVQVLLILMVADYVTGIVSGFVRGKLSSEVGFRGLAKKLLVLLLIAVCHWVEKSVGIDTGLSKIVAIGYCFNETVSIIENTARSGVKIPSQLVEALIKAKSFKAATPEQLERLQADEVVAVRSVETKTRVTERTERTEIVTPPATHAAPPVAEEQKIGQS